MICVSTSKGGGATLKVKVLKRFRDKTDEIKLWEPYEMLTVNKEWGEYLICLDLAEEMAESRNFYSYPLAGCDNLHLLLRVFVDISTHTPLAGCDPQHIV